MTPVARFLVDFGSKPLPEVVVDALPLSAPGLSEQDIAERVDEAYVRGVDEGRRAAEEEGALRVEEQKLATQRAIEAARAAWADEIGPHISAQIESAFDTLQQQIAAAAERALMPFLARAARDEALRQLRATVEGLLAVNPGISLEISGPEDLLDSVRASLPASVAAASFVVTDKADVQLKAGTSLIETRIAAWIKTCEGT
jgi:hypothetical protein